MPGWGDRIKTWLGGSPAKRRVRKGSSRQPAKTPPTRTYVANQTNRAEVINEAMAVYRSRRSEMGGLLDKTLAEMRTKPLKTVSEPDKIVRLLALHRANVGLKSMMAHDLRQYLVLAGIRGLLEAIPGAETSTKPLQSASGDKASRRKISRR